MLPPMLLRASPAAAEGTLPEPDPMPEPAPLPVPEPVLVAPPSAVSLSAPAESAPVPPPAPATGFSWAPTGEPAVETLAALEKRHIQATLAMTAQDVPRAASLLGVNPSTIYRKLQAWKAEG